MDYISLYYIFFLKNYQFTQNHLVAEYSFSSLQRHRITPSALSSEKLCSLGKVTNLLPETSLLKFYPSFLILSSQVSLPTLLLSPHSPSLSLSFWAVESIKFSAHHLQQASFSFLRLLQLWGDPGPNWGIVCGSPWVKGAGPEGWNPADAFFVKDKAPPYSFSTSQNFHPSQIKGLLCIWKAPPITRGVPHPPRASQLRNEGPRICSGQASPSGALGCWVFFFFF